MASSKKNILKKPQTSLNLSRNGSPDVHGLILWVDRWPLSEFYNQIQYNDLSETTILRKNNRGHNVSSFCNNHVFVFFFMPSCSSYDRTAIFILDDTSHSPRIIPQTCQHHTVNLTVCRWGLIPICLFLVNIMWFLYSNVHALQYYLLC